MKRTKDISRRNKMLRFYISNCSTKTRKKLILTCSFCKTDCSWAIAANSWSHSSMTTAAKACWRTSLLKRRENWSERRCCCDATGDDSCDAESETLCDDSNWLIPLLRRNIDENAAEKLFFVARASWPKNNLCKKQSLENFYSNVINTFLSISISNRK